MVLPVPVRLGVQPARITGLVQRAPWYSGMAQGEATGFFAQLAQVARLTDAQRATYRDAADETFVTMTIGPEAAPWVVHTDAEGYLWLEEYPQEPETASDFTYNGHLFATLGMWDYAMLTGSEVAADIFDGALTTAVRRFPSVRNLNWYSDYCVQHDMPHRNYHIAHMNLMLQMQWLSGRPEPAAISDAFVADYPPWGVTGQVIFAGTKHTFYKFTSTGGVSATKTLTFSRQTGANTDLRTRIQGRGIYYRITNGAAAGWYALEAFGRVGLKGHPHRGRLRAGAHRHLPRRPSVQRLPLRRRGQSGRRQDVDVRQGLDGAVRPACGHQRPDVRADLGRRLRGHVDPADRPAPGRMSGVQASARRIV